MEKHGFLTVLFMSIAGVLFMIVAIFLIVIGIKIFADYIDIINKGIEIEATIMDRDLYGSENSATYHIKYMVSGEQHTQSFKSSTKTYRQGDTITIYVLENNPEKIVIPIESNNPLSQTMYSIIGASILMVLGRLCIKNYNVFQYKKFIRVE